MNTVILHEPGKLAHHDASEPIAPDEGEALIRVHRIGFCGTDYHAFHGRQPFFNYPRILGHELGVEVLGVGAGVAGKTGYVGGSAFAGGLVGRSDITVSYDC